MSQTPAGNPNAPGPSTALPASSREVAIRCDFRSVKIQAANRQPGKTMYLWASSKGKSTLMPFKPDMEGPAIIKCPVNPGALEFLPTEDTTTDYVEVGLVYGDNPSHGVSSIANRGNTSNTGGVALASAARYSNAPHRGDRMMRVFTRRTEVGDKRDRLITRFFAGCQLLNGRLHPRVVSVDTVFFYPEVWFWASAADAENDTFEQRRAKLIQACKVLAVHTSNQPVVSKQWRGNAVAETGPAETEMRRADRPQHDQDQPVEQKDLDLLRQRIQLGEEQDQRVEEWYQAVKERDQLVGERDQAAKQVARVLEQLRQAVKQRDRVVEQRDRLVEERDQAVEGRDQLGEERDQAVKQRDRLVQQRDRLANRLVEEHDQAVEERDQLVEQRDQAVKQLNDIRKVLGIARQ